MAFFQNDDDNTIHNSNLNNFETPSEKKEEQLKESFLRLNADFDNYKKRIAKERLSWIVNCQSDLLLDLLPIIDDFDRAFSGYKKGENKDLDNYIQGFELIYKSLYKFLEKYDVKQMTDFSSFNPEYQEAIAQVDSVDHKPGEIVSVLQKGYFIKDKVLRPARVTVSK